jgi:hypothetical protein
VRGLTADNDTEANHRIEFLRLGRFESAKRNLK